VGLTSIYEALRRGFLASTVRRESAGLIQKLDEMAEHFDVWFSDVVAEATQLMQDAEEERVAPNIDKDTPTVLQWLQKITIAAVKDGNQEPEDAADARAPQYIYVDGEGRVEGSNTDARRAVDEEPEPTSAPSPSPSASNPPAPTTGRSAGRAVPDAAADADPILEEPDDGDSDGEGDGEDGGEATRYDSDGDEVEPEPSISGGA
jgi:hypothetical protein